MSEKPRIDQRAPTVLAPASERQATGMPVTIGQKTEPVQQVQKDVRFPIKTMIATFLIGGGVTGTLGYNYLNGLYPFNKDDNQETTASSAASANIEPMPPPKEVPQVIRTNDDLRDALEALNIKATAADFERANANGHFRGLSLRPLNADGGTPVENFQYQWQSLRPNSINDVIKKEDVNQEEAIIATRRMHPNSSIRYLGLQPRAHAKNPDDPAIEYHYYHCEDKSNRELAQISIVLGGKDATFYSIQLPDCRKKQEASQR